jgi:hypothetical protein
MQPERFLGVAGPTGSDAEKATVKQALFLLRYRLRVMDAVGPHAGPQP